MFNTSNKQLKQSQWQNEYALTKYSKVKPIFLLSVISYLLFSINASKVSAQNVFIPDTNFKAALVGDTAINTNADSEIQVSEAAAYTGSISVPNLGISDLTGIEAFVNLNQLLCPNNQLSSLNVSSNIALSDLACGNNQLTSLNVSNNTALYYLDCSFNQITNLDVSNNVNLIVLNCIYNQLTSLGVTSNIALNFLYCGNNQLTSLDVSNNVYLTQLECTSNQLTNLDVSNNVNLTQLECSYNQLTSINLSSNTALIYLSCDYNQLTNLDVFNNVNLIDLRCVENQITSLDVSSNTALNYLECRNNQIASLDVFNNTVLNHLDCSFNQITNLDVSSNFNLIELKCAANQLTNLNVSNNVSLTLLSCAYNQLTNLGLSNNSVLNYLVCNNNQITNLDVSNNVNLNQLSCGFNQLTSLDVSNNTTLSGLACSYNQLTSLDVSNNTALIYLMCSNNYLTNLNVQNGNNVNFQSFENNGACNASNNLQLTCIQVDNPAYSDTASGWLKDANASYSLNCSPIVFIPDTNFKAALVGDTAINTNADSEIQVSEAAAYTGSISVPNLGISDLTGIEAFPNILVLSCDTNQLSSLNVSSNTALLYLSCASNQLASLDVSGNTALSNLSCASNQLTSLDVASNMALNYLICNNNQLTNLNVSNNTLLGSLDCRNNQITNLDVSNNVNLIDLLCDYNELTSLDVSNNIALKYLYCEYNQITGLDISNNTILLDLFCNGNQLYNLDVSNNAALSSLYCNYNQITSLNVSNNTVLTSLDCSNNQLISLDVYNNTTLIELDCSNNQLTSLDVSNNTALNYLLCNNNNLTNLNVQNGNNANFQNYVGYGACNASNNPQLTCIQVDNPAYSDTALGWLKDANASYSLNCSCTSPTSSIITGSDQICAGNSTIFSASASGTDSNTTYAWTGPNGYAASNDSTGYVSEAGLYTCIISNGIGCADTLSRTLTVSPLASSNISISSTQALTNVCLGKSITFYTSISNGGVNPLYQWNVNGNNVQGATQDTFTLVANNPSSIVKCMLLAGVTCPQAVNSNDLQLTTSSSNNFGLNFSSDSTTFTAPPFLVNFTNATTNASNLQFKWFFGDGTYYNGANPPPHIYTNNGSYTVSLLGTNIIDGCTDTLFVPNYINCTGLSNGCAHTASIVGLSNGCAGGTIKLSASTNASNPSFQWNLNGQVIGGENDSIIYANIAGDYSITVYQNGSCPVTSMLKTITFNQAAPSAPQVSVYGTLTNCGSNSIILQASGNFVSYAWSNGQNGNTIQANQSGYYYVTGVTSSGCSVISAPTSINNSNLDAPEICLVTVVNAGTTQLNKIIWSKPITNDIDSFIILRETILQGYFERVGAKAYADSSIFLDSTSQPTLHADRYRIIARETCGAFSLPGKIYRTMFLLVTPGIGNEKYLSWNNQEGQNISTYEIWARNVGSNPTVWTLVDSVSSNVTTWIDPNLSGDTMKYRVDILLNYACISSKDIQAAHIRATSNNGGNNNVLNNLPSILSVSESNNSDKFMLYPNPANDILQIEMPSPIMQNQLMMLDMLGNTIKLDYISTTNNRLLISIKHLTSGMYMMKMGNTTKKFSKVN